MCTYIRMHTYVCSCSGFEIFYQSLYVCAATHTYMNKPAHPYKMTRCLDTFCIILTTQKQHGNSITRLAKPHKTTCMPSSTYSAAPYKHSRTPGRYLERDVPEPRAERVGMLQPDPLSHVILEVIVGVAQLFDQRESEHARVVKLVHDGQRNVLPKERVNERKKRRKNLIAFRHTIASVMYCQNSAYVLYMFVVRLFFVGVLHARVYMCTL
jgi:hypothetical protein